MSAAAPRVVLYEAPASCFGRLLRCFGRPTLHIQNADEELQLPFLLALTPYDGCTPPPPPPLAPPPHTCLYSTDPPRSSNPTHLTMITTFYSKITAESRPVDRVGRCGRGVAGVSAQLCEFELMTIKTGTGKVLVSRETIPPLTLEIWACLLCCRCSVT
jgi:hypothetical protein